MATVTCVNTATVTTAPAKVWRERINGWESGPYNLQFNNCEHFVTWCIQGVHHSEQVDQAWSTVLLAITLAQTPLPPIRTTVPTFPALLTPLTNKLPTWLLPWRLR